jgi:ubiquinone/menaquinone biosynthesis C-methylase UbiE
MAHRTTLVPRDDGHTPTDSTEAGCPACGSFRTRSFLGGNADPERGVPRAFLFRTCDSCGLRFQTVREDVAAGLYADVECAIEQSTLPRRRELRADLDVLRELRRHARGRRLLDVGSGDGDLLKAAREIGLDAEGVDVSPRLAAIAERRSGARVHVGRLAELSLPTARYDVINIEHVLMYVPNPRALLAEARRLLAPGGVLRIREYDGGSLSARVAGKGYWMFHAAHVNVFTHQALAKAAEAAGLRIARVYGGTEASLRTWLETERTADVKTRARGFAEFALRRVRVGRYAVGADTVYHLEAAPARGLRAWFSKRAAAANAATTTHTEAVAAFAAKDDAPPSFDAAAE